MTLENFILKIDLPEDAREAVLAYDVTDVESARLRDLFDTDYNAMHKELMETKAEPYFDFLALYCRWAADSMELWEKSGVPEEIAIDTFRDITIWSNRYRVRAGGKIGLMEWNWFHIHKSVKLFRLGRLQFEPTKVADDVTMPDGTELKAGDEALYVHIPRGGSLTAENIKEAFDMSKTFFPKYFGKSYDTYVCTSWLLAPALGDMISPTSGIAEYRKYFYVYGEDTGYSQAEDYVFVLPNPDKSTYPENTSLQRNLKRYLMNGGIMGMGIGVGKY